MACITGTAGLAVVGNQLITGNAGERWAEATTGHVSYLGSYMS